MDAAPVSVGGSAARSVAVLGASQAVKIVTQFASVILLSRLLSPEDFGVIASIAPVIAFIGIFQDFGMQQAIVQRPTVSNADLTSIFWITLMIGGALTAVMMALSPAAVWFYDDERLFWVTIAAAAPLLVYSLLIVPNALLNRRGKFAVLAINDVIVSAVSLGTALIAALAGLRYWALVLSTIVTVLASAVWMFWQARWSPGRPARVWPDRSLLHFGKNLTGFTMVNYFARNVDNMLIGHAWGGIELGYYDRAYKLLLLPLQNIGMPVARVMIPLLCRIESDKPRLRRTYLRAATQVALVTVPGMAAIVATAPEVIHLVFGERWMAVVPIFFWLGLAGLIQPLTNTTGWIFICQARTQSLFRVGAISAATTVVAFLAGLHWGAVGVAAAYTTTEYTLRLPLNYIWVGRIGPVTAMDLVGVQVPLLAAAALTWVVSRDVLAGPFGFAGVALITSSICASYATALLAVATSSSGRLILRQGGASLIAFLAKYVLRVKKSFA